MRRNQVILLAMAVPLITMIVSFIAGRDDAVVEQSEASCVAAQRAYDQGKREPVLFDIIRDCDRSGFPIKR